MPTSSSPTLDAKVERMRREARQRAGDQPVQQLPPPPPRRGDDWPADDVRVTRQWRLAGYDRAATTGAVVVHESTVVGDRNLDDALRALEGRADVHRITVTLL